MLKLNELSHNHHLIQGENFGKIYQVWNLGYILFGEGVS